MERNYPIQEGSPVAPATYFILISEDGPYLVYGKPPIDQEIITPNEQGDSWNYHKGSSIENLTEPIALCRCGHSKHKPCCDGTHSHIEWDAKETASKEPILESAEQYKELDLILNDNKKYCAIARFCDAKKDIWELMEEPYTEEEKGIIKHMEEHCPSGRLILKNQSTGKIYEPDLNPGIGIIEDPVMKVSGPIWVKGGIRIQSADGSSYEIRNRVTLCRCGHSANKPFCDGKHIKFEFQDGLPIEENSKIDF
ncbi:MAG: CDGSH iron-sulfur domain-containing protein [Bacteroidales bacterium]|nr:CDGSH iron-sulfur domain-containing protein [Bacteroidales bacterium]